MAMAPGTGSGSRRRAVAIAGLAAASWACTGPVRALDVTQPVAVPVPIDDGVLQIGGRKLALPAGQWVLTARSEEPTVAFGRGGQDAWGRAVNVWAVRVDGGRWRGMLRLTLPVEEGRWVRPVTDIVCPNEKNLIQRDLNNPRLQPDCLAVSGLKHPYRIVPDQPQLTLHWLADHGIATPEVAVRFTYGLRHEYSFGRLFLDVPVDLFESDEDAWRWAGAMRDALRAFFEHRSSEATVPALPEAVGRDADVAR
jgi:hypothetical protein